MTTGMGSDLAGLPVPHTPAGDALSEAMHDTYVSRDREMAQRQLAQMWRALRDRGFTVASFADLKETGTEHWNVPCGHGMSAHNDSGCVDCECTTPGFRSRPLDPATTEPKEPE